MNRRLLLVSVLSIFGSLSVPAVAQEDIKIAVVDITKIYSASPQKAVVEKKLEEEFTAKQEKIKDLANEYRALQEKANREAITMNEKDLAKLQEEIIAAERKLKWEEAIYQDDLKIRKKQAFNEVQLKIYQAIRKIGQNGKYDLILQDGIAFRSDRMDVTDQVLKELKK